MLAGGFGVCDLGLEIFVIAIFAQVIHNLFDILGAVFVTDQQHIFRVHYDYIFNADGHRQPVAVDQGIARIQDDTVVASLPLDAS